MPIRVEGISHRSRRSELNGLKFEVDRFLVGGMRISTETRRRGLCLPLAEPFEP